MTEMLVDATSIARMWGHRDATPLDLLQVLTHTRPVSPVLAGIGLTDRSLVEWRRARGHDRDVPLLDSSRHRTLTPVVEQVLTRARAAYDSFWSPAFDGHVARLLLTAPPDQEVAEALRDIAADRTNLGVLLGEQNLRAQELSGDHSVSAFRRRGVVVLEHDHYPRPSTLKYTTWMATAVKAPADAALLGSEVVAALARSPRPTTADETIEAVFRRELGISRLETFYRSARLVHLSASDMVVKMSQTRRERGPAWDGHLDWATPVSAFRDRPEQVGQALTVAFDSSIG